MRIWDVETGKPLFDCRGHTLPVHCLRFSPDGRRLASCACAKSQQGQRAEIKVWDAADGSLLTTLEERGRFFTLTFRPDGRWLASGGEGGVIVWDWLTGRIRTRLESPNPVTALAFSPDGSRLGSAGINEGKVHLWDCTLWERGTDQSEPLRSMAAPGLMCDLTFSPDGKRLVGASRDLLKMWDAETGVEVLTLRGAACYRDPPFNARVAFHPDGIRLAGTNWNESISVWDAPRHTGEEASACNNNKFAVRRPTSGLLSGICKKPSISSNKRTPARRGSTYTVSPMPLCPGHFKIGRSSWSRRSGLDVKAASKNKFVGRICNPSAKRTDCKSVPRKKCWTNPKRANTIVRAAHAEPRSKRLTSAG